MPAQEKIAIFGGTFDPVHHGHLHLAALAKEAFALDAVRFLPCQISPHKSGTAPASGHDRCAMLRLATADFPWALVDDFELDLTGPSYSWWTAAIMAGKFPDARLFWLMGGDQWDALPSWQHPENLSSLVEFVVLARGEPPLPRDGYRLHVVQGAHPASATEIRELLKNGDSPHPWLDPAVARYISEHGLYQ